MKKLYASFLTAFATVSLLGQSVETSGFDPKEIRPDSTSTYTVVLKDINGNISAEDIPMPDGLQIIGQSRSQSFSMGTSGTSSSTSLQYTVRPLKEGIFTVPEWSVEYKGKTYTIAAATLKVDESAPAQQQAQQARDPFGMRSMFGLPSGIRSQSQARQQTQTFDDSLRNSANLEIKLPREEIYVGESVPCELIFSFDKSILRNGFRLAQLIPDIKKADAFDCPAFTTDPTVDEKSDPEKVFIIYHTIVTPLKVGSYDLDFSAKGVFNRDIDIDDLMGMSLIDRMMSMGGGRQIPFEIQMPAKKINVLELPTQGKPENFTGAIGKFSLEDVMVDPDALSVGDPSIITAKLVGMGNFGRISAPELDTGGNWKNYKPKTSFADESNGQGYIGIKTFEYTVVPTKPDLKFAPKILFNYFDPVSKKYVELPSKEIPVSVAPTGRSNRAVQKAQDNKKAEPEFAQNLDKNSQTREVDLLKSPLFWILQAAILAALIAFIAARRRKLMLESNPEYAKKLAYRKQCAYYLAKARDDANRNDAKAFFVDARNALQYSLTAADSDRESSSLILREAREIMQSRNFGQDDIDSINVFFDGADAITFGGLDVSKMDLKELDKSLNKTCKLLEK